MLFPTCLTLPSIFRHFALSPFTWAVNSYTTCAPQVVEHSVLTSRILYFQLNRQFISGRHVSFSVHSLYKSLYVLCICTMATASPPNSIQKTEPFGHYLSSNYATQMNWKQLCPSHRRSLYARVFKFSLLVVLQGTNVTRFYPQWSMQVWCISVHHDKINYSLNTGQYQHRILSPTPTMQLIQLNKQVFTSVVFARLGFWPLCWW